MRMSIESFLLFRLAGVGHVWRYYKEKSGICSRDFDRVKNWNYGLFKILNGDQWRRCHRRRLSMGSSGPNFNGFQASYEHTITVNSTSVAVFSQRPHQFMPKRLQKELMSLIKEPPPGMTLDSSAASQNLMQWTIQMDGAPGTLYEGEKFELLFKFSAKYPFDSPEVTFQGPNIPVHPHVYSNGHICLSILTEDWSPALSVQSVCLSIISMLSSCKEKKRPPDNSFYIKTCNKNPKKTKWWYHDDTV